MMMIIMMMMRMMMMMRRRRRSISTCNVHSSQSHESAFSDRFEARSSLVAINAVLHEVQFQFLSRFLDNSTKFSVVSLCHGGKTGSESKAKEKCISFNIQTVTDHRMITGAYCLYVCLSD